MFLRKFGLNIRQEDIFSRCKVSPLQGRGCVSMELYKALKKMGFHPGDAFHSMNYKFARTTPEEQWDIIYKRLTRGIPTIVCMQYNRKTTYPHFRLVLGYNALRKTVIFHEPNISKGSYREMKLSKFIELWTVYDEDGDPWLVHMSLDMGTLKVKKATASQFLKARLAQAVIRFKSLEIGGAQKFIEPGVLLVFGPQWRSDTTKFRSRFRVYWKNWQKQVPFALPVKRRTLLFSRNERLIRSLKHKPDERILDRPPAPALRFSMTPLARCLPSKMLCGFVNVRQVPTRWEVLRYWSAMHMNALPSWLNVSLATCPDRPLSKREMNRLATPLRHQWLQSKQWRGCKDKRLKKLLLWLTRHKLWKPFLEGWYSRRKKDPQGIQTLNKLKQRTLKLTKTARR